MKTHPTYAPAPVIVQVTYPTGANSMCRARQTTVAAALVEVDPFQSAIHWPAHNVGAYLGRMGVGS